ncbi:MAG: CBS domain-containing protein [Planctomycetes bacterium]|nr:CBS domain-containing protein [Planctomycetota bacterium]
MPEEVTKIQEMVYELLVREVMTKEVISVMPSTPMSDLREILRAKRISGTPVVEDGALVGMVSIEDFIKWLNDGGHACPVADRMTRDVRSIYDDEPLVQAVNRLERLGFGRLPVVARDTGRLVGVITKGDIIRGLLRHLEVDYRTAEMRGARSSHIFEDIQADRSTVKLEYRVRGGDFSRGGASAVKLKTTLLRLGVDPQTTRRAAVATYEAEMNLIVFTQGGRIAVELGADTMRIEVEDQGPGIPDIEKAMQPGFSTAPDWVRELGFGAGMGLPNIKKCSDRMRIDSAVGKGTRLEVEILMEHQGEPERDSAQARA